ncbi:MAG: tetratricopeptide repeat protein [Snowella sp.]|nr:tetratricopeptide repeat protein [Snowella sp.]
MIHRDTKLCNLRRIEEAISSYNEALNIKRDYHEALNNRGYALLKTGNYNEAMQSISQFLDINPNPWAISPN